MKHRITVAVLVAVAALALLFCTVSVVVNSSAVHRLIVSRVNDALPGTIKFGRLHIALLNGRIELSEGAIMDPSGKQIAGFGRLRIDLSLPRLLGRTLVVESAVIEQPWVVLATGSGGRLTLLDVFSRNTLPDSTVVKKDRTSMPFRLFVRGFRIVDGAICYAAQQGRLSVRATGLSAIADGEPAAGSGSLSLLVDSVAVDLQEKNLNFRDVVVMARMRDLNVDTISLRMKMGASALSLDGSVLSTAENPVLKLNLTADVALAEIGRIVGVQEESDGTAELHIKISGPVANPAVDLEVAYHGGTVMGYAIDSLGGRAILTDRILTIAAVHAEAASGTVDLAGNVDARAMFPGGFFVPPVSVQKLGYALSISGSAIALEKMMPAISGSAGGTVTLCGNGVHPDSLTASVGISAHVTALHRATAASPLDAVVACSVSVMRGTARVHTLQGTLGNSSVALAGTYNIPAGELDASVSITAPELDTLFDFAGIDSVAGSAKVTAIVKGTPKRPEVSVVVHADTVACRNLRVGKASLYAGLDRYGTVRVQNLTIANGSSRIHGTGSAKVLDGGAPLPVDRMTFDCSVVCPELHAGDFIDSVDGVQRSAVATFSATLKGDLLHPEAKVDLHADSIVYRNTRIGSIALVGGLEPGGTVRVQRLTCENGRSNLNVTGAVKLLDRGRILPPGLMDFEGTLGARRLNIADFIDSAAGIVVMDAVIKGTIHDIRGHIGFDAENVAVAGQNVSRFELEAEMVGQRAIVQKFDVTVAPGQNLNVTGWASLKDSFDLAVAAAGINLNRIAALDKVDSLDGVVSIDLQAGGVYYRPDVRGTLNIKGIRMGSLPLEDIGLQVKLHNQQVELQGRAGGNLRAGCNLDTKVFAAEVTVDKLQLTPYLALAGKDLDGTITAEMRVSGDIDSVKAITGTLTIGSLLLGYRQQTIIETHGLHVSLSENRYDVPDFKVSLAGEGVLTGHAQGLLEGPHEAQLSGAIPLVIVRHFVPELSDIGGYIDIVAFFKGTVEAAGVNADVRFRDINLTIPGMSQRIHALNGHLLADQNSIRFDALEGNVDDGSFRMTGELHHQGLTLSTLNAEITLNALPLSVDGMLGVVFDGKLRVRGTPDTTDVNGDLVLLDGLYYRDFQINPLAMVTERRRTASPPAAGLTAPYVRNMRFDVGVKAQSPFRVDNNLTRLNIAPDLHLMGTIASPSLGGRAVVEQGTISYLRQTFTVDHGVVDFVNPYAIEPQLDIQGSVPVENRIIRITLSGPPEDLAFTLAACDKNGSADETLEDQDILSLLILGKTTSELHDDLKKGGIVQSNQQMLAALVASTFGEDIRKVTGLDMLEVETSGDTSDRIAVTVGKQLTRRFGTSYTVESDNGGILQRATAEYRLLQNLYFAGFQDTKGIYGGAIRFTWEKR